MSLADLDFIIQVVFKGEEDCACCGTTLAWHVRNAKRASVFHASTDELFCSYKCMKETTSCNLPYQRFGGLKHADPELVTS